MQITPITMVIIEPMNPDKKASGEKNKNGVNSKPTNPTRMIITPPINARRYPTYAKVVTFSIHLRNSQRKNSLKQCL